MQLKGHPLCPFHRGSLWVSDFGADFGCGFLRVLGPDVGADFGADFGVDFSAGCVDDLGADFKSTFGRRRQTAEPCNFPCLLLQLSSYLLFSCMVVFV